jgi:hypothetical protein
MPKPKKPKMSFAERLNRYPTYNPATEGFGSVTDWQAADRKSVV